jgi:predicted ribosome quality control (RQC) complex YloA/Tae2 family protein
MKFKRAIKGYSREWIDKTINSLKSEHSNRISQLEQSLSSLLKENENLREEIELLLSNITQHKKVRSDMADELHKAHLSASRHVYDTVERVKLQEDKRLEIISKHEKEKAELKEILKSLSGELQSKVEEYKHKLEVFSIHKGESADVK